MESLDLSEGRALNLTGDPVTLCQQAIVRDTDLVLPALSSGTLQGNMVGCTHTTLPPTGDALPLPHDPRLHLLHGVPPDQEPLHPQRKPNDPNTNHNPDSNLVIHARLTQTRNPSCRK